MGMPAPWLTGCISQAVAIYATGGKLQAVDDACRGAPVLLSDQPVARDLRGHLDLARAARPDVRGQAPFSRALAIQRTYLVEHPRGPSGAPGRARAADQVR